MSKKRVRKRVIMTSKRNVSFTIVEAGRKERSDLWSGFCLTFTNWVQHGYVVKDLRLQGFSLRGKFFCNTTNVRKYKSSWEFWPSRKDTIQTETDPKWVYRQLTMSTVCALRRPFQVCCNNWSRFPFIRHSEVEWKSGCPWGKDFLPKKKKFTRFEFIFNFWQSCQVGRVSLKLDRKLPHETRKKFTPQVFKKYARL
jgi:hypothetical protein